MISLGKLKFFKKLLKIIRKKPFFSDFYKCSVFQKGEGTDAWAKNPPEALSFPDWCHPFDGGQRGCGAWRSLPFSKPWLRKPHIRHVC